MSVPGRGTSPDNAAAQALAERVAEAMFADDRASQAMGMSIALYA